MYYDAGYKDASYKMRQRKPVCVCFLKIQVFIEKYRFVGFKIQVCISRGWHVCYFSFKNL